MKPPVEVIVERTHANGELPAISDIQRLVHLVNDRLRALNVIVDALIKFLGIVDGKPESGLLEKPNAPIKEQ
jgi:hypothetical protein